MSFGPRQYFIHLNLGNPLKFRANPFPLKIVYILNGGLFDFWRCSPSPLIDPSTIMPETSLREVWRAEKKILRPLNYENYKTNV